MGKIERVHHTMQAEILQGRRFADFGATQTGLDIWCRHDNHEWPHDAAPASRYHRNLADEPPLPARHRAEHRAGTRLSRRRSRRPRPHRRLPALWYRRIDLELSIAIAGELAAVRPSTEDGVCHV